MNALSRKEAIRRFIMAGIIVHPAIYSLVCSTGQVVGSVQGRSLAELLPQLKKLQEDPDRVRARSGFWSPGKVFAHCAQSIRFGREGFPELKSGLFRYTIGSAAFGVFSLRDSMSHGLTEPIPGAPEIAEDYSVASGLEELIKEVESFLAYSGPLKPHFAYGNLDHEQYDRANTWHILNHWDGLDIQA